MKDSLFMEEESYAIRGAVFEVYREMGVGFLESVYQECMERELRIRGIPFEREKELALDYKGVRLDQTYRPDFLCYGSIILELKCIRRLQAEHRAQVLNYLRASGLRLGFLVNFSTFPKAIIERFVL